LRLVTEVLHWRRQSQTTPDPVAFQADVDELLSPVGPDHGDDADVEQFTKRGLAIDYVSSPTLTSIAARRRENVRIKEKKKLLVAFHACSNDTADGV
jgi:hypothetical protein